MTSIFTEHVQALLDGRGADDEQVRAVFREIHRVIHGEMARRQVLGLPPAAFGYPHVPSWTHAPALDEGEVNRFRLLSGAARPFEEFVADAYERTVLRPMKRWAGRLVAGDTIDGAVVFRILRYVGERQKAGDPVGAAVYENGKRAVDQGLTDGWLERRDGATGPIRNCVVLAFPGMEDGVHDPAPDVLVAAVARGDASGALLPRLGDVDVDLARLLAEALRRLPDAGVTAFRFGALMDALKSEARAGWKDAAEEELPPLSAREAALDAVEDDQEWALLRRRVHDLIERGPRRKDTKVRLHDLLDTIDVIRDAAPGDEPPSDAELARRTGVAKQTVSGWIRTLRTLALLARLESEDDRAIAGALGEPRPIVSLVGFTGDRARQHAQTMLRELASALDVPADTPPLHVRALSALFGVAAADEDD